MSKSRISRHIWEKFFPNDVRTRRELEELNREFVNDAFRSSQNTDGEAVSVAGLDANGNLITVPNAGGGGFTPARITLLDSSIHTSGSPFMVEPNDLMQNDDNASDCHTVIDESILDAYFISYVIAGGGVVNPVTGNTAAVRMQDPSDGNGGQLNLIPAPSFGNRLTNGNFRTAFVTYFKPAGTLDFYIVAAAGITVS